MYIMPAAVVKTQPSKTGPANKRIFPNYLLNLWKSVPNALSKISAGKKMNRKRCGSI